jgi:hypothetical protein
MAALPVPSAKPAAVPRSEPPPASEVTMPLTVFTWRTRLLSVSATKIAAPVDRPARPRGPRTWAAVVAPSAKPATVPPPPPSAVVTTPVPLTTARMTLLE